MSEDREAIIKAIKNCAFDGNPEYNVDKSATLMKLKVKFQELLMDSGMKYEKKKNEIMLSEKITGQKTNAEQREAIIALEMEGTDAEKLAEYRLYLGVINSVENHNANVLAILFKAKE